MKKKEKKKIYRKDRRTYLNKMDFYFRISELLNTFLVSENSLTKNNLFNNYEYLSIFLKNITINNRKGNRKFSELTPFDIKNQNLNNKH